MQILLIVVIMNLIFVKLVKSILLLYNFAKLVSFSWNIGLLVILDLFSHFENLNSTDKSFSVPKIGIVSYGISTTTLEEVFLKLEEEEVDSDNATSELEQNAGLRNNVLFKADKTDIGGSSNNLYASTAVHEQTGSSDGKLQVSLWVHLMALLEVPG